MAFNDLVKDCPICQKPVKPFECQVLPSGVLLYKFECGPCKWPFVKRVQARPTVEPLKGFVNKPLRWEK